MTAGIRDDAFTTPHPDRLTPDHPQYQEILQAHSAACEAGSMGYTDPASGLFAMTAVYLASRDCCTRGCRHCPYIGATGISDSTDEIRDPG